MYILGISAFYHDSAACVLKDGEILAAAQEERFTRVKHDLSFPTHAIKYCLAEAGIEPANLENVVFYEKPFVKFERLLETYLAVAPKGISSFAKAMPLWVKDKLFQKKFLCEQLSQSLDPSLNWKSKLLFSEHHLSHAASAFFPSPYENAAVLTLDGVGEWSTTSLALGAGSELKILQELHFPHSIGLLYSAFTYFIGFKVNSGEYKLMGLAPFGTPKYVELIEEHLINIAEDGSFQLNMKYFDFATNMRMTNRKFANLFDGPRREPESELTQREMDLAASVQTVTEKVIVKIARHAAKTTGMTNLCLAGGVALNCVANGRLIKENIFENIWVQPAAGDAGGALGAALAVWHLHHKGGRNISGADAMKGAYLGPAFSNEDIESQLIAAGAKFRRLPEEALIDTVAQRISEGKAIGWMQGRMEFGPRALGARSILADPRSPETQRNLNLKTKFRESFRPFAPSVLRDHLAEWFQLDQDSPFMLLVAGVQNEKRLSVSEKDNNLFGIQKLNVPKSAIPAVTHVDYSARIQTVHEETNPIYHKIISKFYELTGCPVVVNTSFNVRGEPIVCSPKDAFNCFMGTDLDLLAVGCFLLEKNQQDLKLLKDYKGRYELD